MTLRRGSGIVLAVWLVTLVGCIVVHDNPPPRRVVVVESPPPPPPPPPPAREIVITQDDEVHYVVYREYFGCTEEEIYVLPHYRRYYAVTDDDIYFIMFVSRQRAVPFDVCFRSYYYDCGRSYDRLVVTYNCPRSCFFCSAGVGVTSYPPVYQRTYVAYQQNTVNNITIQNHEYVALVHMKVGVEYQGHPPATYFAQVNAHGGNTGQVIVSNREMCGRGGVTATGARVTATAPRPWTMPPAQKQTWHEEHKAAVVQHEDHFKEVHKEQVQKVQAQPKARTPAQGAAQGRERDDKTRTPAQGQGQKGYQTQGPGDKGHPPQKGEEHLQGRQPPPPSKNEDRYKGEDEKKKEKGKETEREK